MLQQTASPLRTSAVVLTIAVALFGVAPYRVTANTSLKDAALPVVRDGTHVVVMHDDNRDYAHVLIDGDNMLAVGSSDDIQAAQRLQRNDEPLLWVRKGDKHYVVRDVETIRRLQAAYAPVSKLGLEQGRLGEKQGELGAQQGQLGARQGEQGAREARMLAEYAAAAAARASLGSGSGSSPNEAAVQQRQDAWEQQSEELARQQEALGKRQEALGRQQEMLGERQQAASEAALREANKVIDHAIASDLAQPVEG